MIQVTLFTLPALEEENRYLQELFTQFQETYSYQLTIVDVNQNAYLQKAYAQQLPRLEIGPFYLIGNITGEEIKTALDETGSRIAAAAQKNDTAAISQYSAPKKLTFGNLFTLWFSRHYLLLFNLLVFIYVGLPFLAPVLMKLDQPKTAQVIYRMYSSICHQLGYRSFFLFGEQAVYPRELAHVDGLIPYGLATGQSEEDLLAAKQYIGNDTVGYKVALCQRDIAIYLSILLFGLFFGLFKRKTKPIPWYIWVIFGLLPIGLDGLSQLVGQLGLAVFSWFPVRESTPFFRVLTGVLFGLFTAWLGYPTIEETVRMTRERLEKKSALSAVLALEKEPDP
ncbi:MAG: DUF2085 domain-containing protein [Anaerolineaceae bacterium]